jgi:hypothetical protein
MCGSFTRPRMPDEANASERLCPDFRNKADFVEVIRCGKCRFRNTDGFCFKNINGVGYKKVSADDYCSYGKTKESE